MPNLTLVKGTGLEIVAFLCALYFYCAHVPIFEVVCFSSKFTFK